jgi:hypothetical protein
MLRRNMESAGTRTSQFVMLNLGTMKISNFLKNGLSTVTC